MMGLLFEDVRLQGGYSQLVAGGFDGKLDGFIHGSWVLF